MTPPTSTNTEHDTDTNNDGEHAKHDGSVELFWLSVYDPHTGSATKVVGSLAVDGNEFEAMLNPIAAADPWRDTDREQPSDYFADANGQTRGVIDAVVPLNRNEASYTLNQLVALANLAAIGHAAT